MAWRRESEPPSENVRTVLDELFQTEIISEKQKRLMTSDEKTLMLMVTDPNLEMDFRHKRAKNITARSFSRDSILIEAKRLVTQEELTEKEIKYKNKVYEKDLEQFKMDITKSSRIDFVQDCPTVQNKPSTTCAFKRRVKSSSYADGKTSIKFDHYAEHMPQIVNESVVTKFKFKIKKFDEQFLPIEEKNNDSIISKRTTSLEDLKINQITSECNTLPPMHTVKTCYENKFNIIEATFGGENYGIHGSNKSEILKNSWKSWRDVTKANKIKNLLVEKRSDRISKIHNFVSEMALNAMIESQKRKREKVLICPYLPEAKMKKKFSCNTIQVDTNKMQTVISKNEQIALEKIVMKQKNKLKEQQQIINELKLEQIKLASERAAQQSQIYLEKSLQEVTLPMQRKLNYLKSTFPSISDNNYKKMKPSFLLQMEERHRERQKRKDELREKTKLRIEEQQKLREERERESKAQLAEQRRLEYKLKLREIEEQARLRALKQRAIKFCQRRRLRMGFGVFRKLLQCRDSLRLAAEVHFCERTRVRAWTAWRLVNESAQEAKLRAARKQHQVFMLRSTWNTWRELVLSARRDRQVAEDFDQLRTEVQAFQRWRGFTQVRYLALCNRMEQARAHHQRRVLARSLAAWRRLREARDTERRAERKKEALRNSVRLVVPDFMPALKT